MRARSHCALGALLTATIILASLPALTIAQSPPARMEPPVRTFLEHHAEIARLAPTGRVAAVSQLVLRRDVGEITLERGQIFLLSPVGGRTVGAFFRGTGRFRFAPLDPVERAQLQRFADAPALDAPLTEAILLFTDSTGDQIERLPFGAAAVPDDIAGLVNDLVRSLSGEHQGSLDGDVMEPLINPDNRGFFLAHIRRTRGDPVLFQVNPTLAEAVRLLRPVNRREWGRNWAVVSSAPAESRMATETRTWRYVDRLEVSSYVLDVRLSERLDANLAMTATATLTLVPVTTVGPWLRFTLDPELDVDSARWGSGEPAFPFKADDETDLWLRMPSAAPPGDTLRVAVFYHGTAIDRYGEFFYVDPASSWFPRNAEGERLSLFDITYHSPFQYPLVSTGERVDSSRAERVVNTRWVTQAPIPHATFNLGLFRARRFENPGAPVLDVFMSDDAHRILRRDLASRGILLLEQSNMSEVVAADISNSLAIFQSLYGEPPFQRFTVTEIPYSEGVSFPGMIHLSWGTFSNTSTDGFDQFFRAHEAAHQWWGNAIRAATYRDAWLSEGLATHSALVYLQTVKRRNDDYYRFLDRFRTEILALTRRGGPISIGYRNATPDAPSGYQHIVYGKGAWVLHMLRVLMLDLSTLRSDRFNEMLRDYYGTFRGGEASTLDFRAILERHAGVPMGWFFDQWVHGTHIPTYRVSWRSEAAEGGRFRVHLTVRQENVPEDFRMPVLVAVDLGDRRTARFRIEVHGGQTEYASPLLPAEPRSLTFNEFQSVLAEVRMER